MLQRALALVIVICAFGIAHGQPRGAATAPPRAAGREMKVAILLAPEKSSTDAALPGLDAAKKHGRIAVAVRLAERGNFRRIFTLDRRDFSLYRPTGVGRFIILPAAR